MVNGILLIDDMFYSFYRSMVFRAGVSSKGIGIDQFNGPYAL